MEITALQKLKHKDIGALFIFCLIGLLVGSAVQDPTWAAYTAFLVFDHLALGWLVFMDENRSRRDIPIEVIVPVHMAFVVLVVVVVAARDSLPYFGFFPYPMAAMAIWLLSSAIGFEKSNEDRSRDRRLRSTVDIPRRQELKKPVRTRPASRARRPARATRDAQHAPAIKEWQPEASSDPPETEPDLRDEQTQPANGSPQTATAGFAAHPEPAMPAYQPTVSGVALALEIPIDTSQPAPEPELCRDNSIAESLRQTPPEAIIRHNPILAATAEDNEEWLRLRRLRNPTHRKLGMSVRDEYEQWLRARIRARTPASATAQSSQESAS